MLRRASAPRPRLEDAVPAMTTGGPTPLAESSGAPWTPFAQPQVGAVNVTGKDEIDAPVPRPRQDAPGARQRGGAEAVAGIHEVVVNDQNPQRAGGRGGERAPGVAKLGPGEPPVDDGRPGRRRAERDEACAGAAAAHVERRVDLLRDVRPILAVRGECALPHAIEGDVVVPGGDDDGPGSRLGRLRDRAEKAAGGPVLARLGALREVAGGHHGDGVVLFRHAEDGGGGARPVGLAEVQVGDVEDRHPRGPVSGGGPASAFASCRPSAVPAQPAPLPEQACAPASASTSRPPRSASAR